jgi:hypothetical protein
MSDLTPGGGPPKGSDPVFKFLAGCALVAGGLIALCVVVASFVGWKLVRDETPGRTEESLPDGSESRYWCLDLRPGDAGVQALLDHAAEINDATRRQAVHGTVLEGVPLPSRHARLDEIAPLKLEFSMFLTPPRNRPQTMEGWAARGAFSHGVLRLRAAVRLMGWLFARKSGALEPIDIGGVHVMHAKGKDLEFAVATVGNRLLVTSDDEQMTRLLEATPSARPYLPEQDPLRKAVRLEGEDGWALERDLIVRDMPHPVAVTRSAASFDLNEKNELQFRIAVANVALAEVHSIFDGSSDDCRAVASSYLVGLPPDAIDIDGAGATSLDFETKIFSGRVTGISGRLGALVERFSEKAEEKARPSATPTPPSPPPTSGPRTGTPEGRPHAGNPTPAR